ncbi:MAG: hypothetical protein RL662_688 [Bacteroidota bacterium]|jgi:hypothetical protein
MKKTTLITCILLYIFCLQTSLAQDKDTFPRLELYNDSIVYNGKLLPIEARLSDYVKLLGQYDTVVHQSYFWHSIQMRALAPVEEKKQPSMAEIAEALKNKDITKLKTTTLPPVTDPAIAQIEFTFARVHNDTVKKISDTRLYLLGKDITDTVSKLNKEDARYKIEHKPVRNIDRYEHSLASKPFALLYIQNKDERSTLLTAGYGVSSHVVKFLNTGANRNLSPKLNTRCKIVIGEKKTTINGKKLPFGKPVKEWVKLLGNYDRGPLEGDNTSYQYMWDEQGISLDTIRNTFSIYLNKPDLQHSIRNTFAGGVQIGKLILGGDMYPKEFSYQLQKTNPKLKTEGKNIIRFDLPSQQLHICIYPIPLSKNRPSGGMGSEKVTIQRKKE